MHTSIHTYTCMYKVIIVSYYEYPLRLQCLICIKEHSVTHLPRKYPYISHVHGNWLIALGIQVTVIQTRRRMRNKQRLKR